MPRYFFTIADGVREPDDVGTELPDREAARKEAIRFAGSILQHEPDLLCTRRQLRIEVTDERGWLVFMVAALAMDMPEPSPASADTPA